MDLAVRPRVRRQERRSRWCCSAGRRRRPRRRSRRAARPGARPRAPPIAVTSGPLIGCACWRAASTSNAPTCQSSGRMTQIDVRRGAIDELQAARHRLMHRLTRRAVELDQANANGHAPTLRRPAPSRGRAGYRAPCRTRRRPSVAELIDIWQRGPGGRGRRRPALTTSSGGCRPPCPGWSVGDVVAHVIDIEQLCRRRAAAGARTRLGVPAARASDFGRLTEIGVDFRRGRAPRGRARRAARDDRAATRAARRRARGRRGHRAGRKLMQLERCLRIAHLRHLDARAGHPRGDRHRRRVGHAAAGRRRLRADRRALPYVWARTVEAPGGATCASDRRPEPPVATSPSRRSRTGRVAAPCRADADRWLTAIRGRTSCGWPAGGSTLDDPWLRDASDCAAMPNSARPLLPAMSDHSLATHGLCVQHQGHGRVRQELRDRLQRPRSQGPVDDAVVERQRQLHDRSRHDWPSTTHARSRTRPIARIAVCPGLRIGVPPSTPKTPTFVSVMVPPVRSRACDRPARAVSISACTRRARSRSPRRDAPLIVGTRSPRGVSAAMPRFTSRWTMTSGRRGASTQVELMQRIQPRRPDQPGRHEDHRRDAHVGSRRVAPAAGRDSPSTGSCRRRPTR